MSDHNDNDDDDFVDQHDVDVPYDIDDYDDDNFDVHDDDACHNTFGYCGAWDIGVNNK